MKIIEYSPVFIIGMPRSGTTLVSNFLNATGEIYIPEETHFYAQKSKYYQSRIITSTKTFNEFYLNQANFYVPFLNLSEEEFELLKKSDDVFLTLIKLKCKDKNIANWGEKTPNHLIHIKEILSDFPNAKFIHIIRDPRDVIFSMIGSNWVKLFPLYRKLNEYKIAFKLYSNQEKDNTQIFHVKYEDLVTRPKEILISICNFCNLNYSDKILENFNSSGNINFSIAKEPWKKNNLKPLNKSSVFKWKTKENSFKVKFISWYLSKPIEFLNYPKANYPFFLFRYLFFINIYLIDKALYIKGEILNFKSIYFR